MESERGPKADYPSRNEFGCFSQGVMLFKWGLGQLVKVKAAAKAHDGPAPSP